MRKALLLLVAAGLIVTPLHAARQPLRAKHGMVVAMEAIAADVGVSVLQKGGNAVDAAVAVGFALAVTHPFAGNLGASGFMTIRLADGRTTFIDFREVAPGKSTHDMYLDASGKPTRDSVEGWRSAAVPGMVRGMEMARTKYGARPWADDIAPAIELAGKGFPVSYALAEGLKGSKSLATSPESKRIFQKNGEFFQMGDTLVQPELAQTLTRIAKNGPNEFYEGETAKRFADEMTKHGGLITTADLKAYKAIERKPLVGTYHGYEVITAPPSSSGGIALLEMLGILDGTGYEKGGAGSASAIHYVAEAMRRAYADRNEYVGDPDFVKVPIAGLLDKSYLARLRSTIDPERATPSENVKPGKPVGTEHQDTTHYSVVDKDGKLFMTVGAPGGGRITTAVLQVILNVVDFGMNVQDAVDAPRFHHQWQPDKLSLERGISPDTVALLKSRGYDVDYAPGVVLAQVAAIVSDGGWLQGASDGRTAAGKAAGY
jgi:gamma-glutamyltranspeptidase/glutathione hydrolase